MVWTSDDESDLEVLPPSSRKPVLKRDEERPRLSYSGGTSKDPVNLLLDEDDEEEDNTSNPSSNFASISNHKSLAASNSSSLAIETAYDLKPTSKPPIKISNRNVFDDTDDSSIDSLASLEAKVRRKKPPPRSPDSDLLLSQSNKSKVTKKPPPKAKAKKKRTSSDEASLKPKKVTKAEQKKLAAEERKRQRELKKAAEEAEKQSKKRHIQQCKQMSGKLAQDEIAILLDTSFHHTTAAGANDPPWVEALRAQTGPRLEYHIVDHMSALPGTAVVQWIRKDALDGGAAVAVEALHSQQHDKYEHIPVVAIVVDLEILMTLLERDPGEDDYPKLAEWIQSIEIGWRASWRKSHTNERPRIILLLDGVKEALELKWTRQPRKTKHTTGPRAFIPTMEELHDALTWLLISYRIEAIHCRTQQAITTHVTKATRMLSEKRYTTETSELECVKKIPQHCHKNDSDEIRVQDTFCRQLQQIPRVSRIMALSVSNYYPTLQSLWEDYASEQQDEMTKRLLLASMFNERSQQTKLANQVYTLFTSNDPSQVLN